ncbi:MAG TPA: YciI family protein [Symbiobacteriaceae bacterium]|nr:YciI family protein [Symbiobacteriaceae bacterium]
MRYLLIICHDESFAPAETLFGEIGAWIGEMVDRGIHIDGQPLRPPGDAMTVRVREGSVQVTKGPFADSREKMCAYHLLECGSLEEAVDAASRHPMAKVATIEVRPVWADIG